MNLETVVLGFLNENSMTGYDLSKWMDSSVGFFWHATHPQIYTCLKKLENDGFVKSNYKISKAGPSKKVYTITKEGKEELLKKLSGEIVPYEGKFPLLVTMFHGSELGMEHWVQVLKSQIDEQQSKLEVFESILEQIPDLSEVRDLSIYLRKRTLEFGIGYQHFFLQWLNETLKELQK